MKRSILIGGIVAIAAIVAVVAVFLVPLLLGAFGPPVDVYARPTPSVSEEPMDLLPTQVAGHDFMNAQLGKFSDGGIGATGTYTGGVSIGISRYNSVSFATTQMDAAMTTFGDGADSFASVDAGEQHWFTATGDGLSMFAWRKGVWVFVVWAADPGSVNQVVGELSF